ncbi:MAG: protein-glutamate O-methyltransferase [Deltaproteobacteria bacterium]|jgi:chemotaxis protein methyltransferase CheR|nr:protein-glutamate O-methyltransferase [Deltaproteobacteria bacterium]
MEDDMPNSLFQQYSRLVYEQCGINLHEGKKALLQARLNKRLRMTGIDSYKEYFKFITSGANPGEFVNFIDSISTNLTYFFREAQHFDFMNRVGLPELIEAKRKQRDVRIRIWSAGCSTGEEPYSLAMCVLAHLQDITKWDFRILATDISTRVLETASRGVYSEEKVKKVPPALRHAYFRKVGGEDGNSDFQIVPHVKRLITFYRLNLKDPYPFKGPFDFIFCRNVMIYFDKKTQEELVNKMAGFLRAGGYFCVGHSESLTGLAHKLSYVQPAIYRN